MEERGGGEEKVDREGEDREEEKKGGGGERMEGDLIDGTRECGQTGRTRAMCQHSQHTNRLQMTRQGTEGYRNKSHLSD